MSHSWQASKLVFSVSPHSPPSRGFPAAQAHQARGAPQRKMLRCYTVHSYLLLLPSGTAWTHNCPYKGRGRVRGPQSHWGPHGIVLLLVGFLQQWFSLSLCVWALAHPPTMWMRDPDTQDADMKIQHLQKGSPELESLMGFGVAQSSATQKLHILGQITENYLALDSSSLYWGSTKVDLVELQGHD